MAEGVTGDQHEITGYLLNISRDSFREYDRIRSAAGVDQNPIALWEDGYFRARGCNPDLGTHLRRMVQILRIGSPRLQIHVCRDASCEYHPWNVLELPVPNGTGSNH